MDDERVRILLVEDDSDDVYVMRNLLGDRWHGSYDLVNVELLSMAIQRCQEEKFDVILLDLGLPDSNGLETFFSLYAYAEEVPIVVLSGYNDERVAVKAVQSGAQDYLVKGQLTDRLLVRSLRYAIERNRRHHAEDAMRDTSEEFRAAGEIQQRLYPTHAPSLEGFEIAGALYPAKATAGDYFDYIPMLDNNLGVVLGDVSSHGMGPALVMSETRACLRTLAQAITDVGEILTRANKVLAADSSELHFVTLAMARLDPSNRTMTYASAGQRGYLLHPGCNVTILDSTGLPLGIREDTVVPSSKIYNLQSGDLVTFFTDGVVEAESPGLVRFGFSRALEAIRSERQKPAKDIIDSLYNEITGFCRKQPQRDDITIVIVKVL
jgi:phosphoserine phosphatase RsbU/P